MEVYIVASMLLFYGALIEAKEALRSNGGKLANLLEKNLGKDQSELLAVVIMEDPEASTETNPSEKYKEPMLPLIDYYKPQDNDEDSSGESNSDEYPNTDTDSDSDSESNYYHEDDYMKDKLMKKLQLLDTEKHELELLRNRWKSCQKAQYKTCKKACSAAYKNACDQRKCKKKLKKLLKKECKINCKEFFME